jgi:hypothetical protein
MADAANEFFAKVQRARELIFKRYLICFLCLLASMAVQQFVQPFPDYIVMGGFYKRGCQVKTLHLIRRGKGFY